MDQVANSASKTARKFKYRLKVVRSAKNTKQNEQVVSKYPEALVSAIRSSVPSRCIYFKYFLHPLIQIKDREQLIRKRWLLKNTYRHHSSCLIWKLLITLMHRVVVVICQYALTYDITAKLIKEELRLVEAGRLHQNVKIHTGDGRVVKSQLVARLMRTIAWAQWSSSLLRQNLRIAVRLYLADNRSNTFSIILKQIKLFRILWNFANII